MMGEAVSVGAEFAYLAIGIAIFWIAYKVGQWVTDKTRRFLPGFAAAIGVIVLAGVIIGPLLNSLNSARCNGDAACEEGPTADY